MADFSFLPTSHYSWDVPLGDVRKNKYSCQKKQKHETFSGFVIEIIQIRWFPFSLWLKWLNSQVWIERQWDYVLRVFLQWESLISYNEIGRIWFLQSELFRFKFYFPELRNTKNLVIPASTSWIGKSFILITRMLVRIISKDNLISDTFRYTWLDSNFEILTISFPNKFFQF